VAIAEVEPEKFADEVPHVRKANFVACQEMGSGMTDVTTTLMEKPLEDIIAIWRRLRRRKLSSRLIGEVGSALPVETFPRGQPHVTLEKFNDSAVQILKPDASIRWQLSYGIVVGPLLCLPHPRMDVADVPDYLPLATIFTQQDAVAHHQSFANIVLEAPIIPVKLPREPPA
jgi:hypothetical protein